MILNVCGFVEICVILCVCVCVCVSVRVCARAYALNNCAVKILWLMLNDLCAE